MRQPVRKVGEVKDYFNLLMSCCMQKSAIAIKSILHLHVGHMSTLYRDFLAPSPSLILSWVLYRIS